MIPKYARAKELAAFLKIPFDSINSTRHLFQLLAAAGWRWDKPSQKWVHASNHSEEIGNDR